MDDPEAALMRVLYDEHAAALWRYAVRLTGDHGTSRGCGAGNVAAGLAASRSNRR